MRTPLPPPDHLQVAWLRLEWEPAWMPAARQRQWDEAQARERAQRAEREAASASSPPADETAMRRSPCVLRATQAIG